MLKKATLPFLLFSLIAFTSARVHAQSKIGYIHMEQLVASMPEAKRAIDTLKLYEQELMKDAQVLVNEFQSRVERFNKEEPSLKPDIKAIKIKELETAKATIEEYKMRLEQRLGVRQEELISPIIAKAKKAVADLAAEKGIAVVLDSSKEILVVATCEDLMAPAKQKLGIK